MLKVLTVDFSELSYNMNQHQRRRRLLRSAKIFLFVPFLTACSTTEKIDIPQKVPIRIHAGSNLNQGDKTKPLALVLKIFHLKSLERFEHTAFNSFLDESKYSQALGSDLVDARELLILPGQSYTIEETVEIDSHYLGVVAFFRQPALERWRFSYEAGKSIEHGITLGVHACALTSTDGALVTALSDAADSLSAVHCRKAR